MWRGGRDERVPPKRGPEKQVPPRGGLNIKQAMDGNPTHKPDADTTGPKYVLYFK